MTAPRSELTGVPAGMGDDDAELLRAAEGLLDERYVAGVHEVAAALRLADGNVVRGLHVEASAGRASVCAESAALSAAFVAGSAVVSIVSVLRRPGGSRHLIEPCGVCAELIFDHAPAARVWVDAEGAPLAVLAAELLPFAHVRTARLSSRSPEGSPS